MNVCAKSMCKDKRIMDADIVFRGVFDESHALYANNPALKEKARSMFDRMKTFTGGLGIKNMRVKLENEGKTYRVLFVKQ